MPEVCSHEPLAFQLLVGKTLFLVGFCVRFCVRGNGFASAIMRVVGQSELIHVAITKIHTKIHDVHCE